MDNAASRRRRDIVSASVGTSFPALGVHVAGEDVMAGGLVAGSFRRSRPVGKIKGARAEILAGRHIDDAAKWGMRLLTGSTPLSPEIVFITFADGSFFERKLRAGWTVEGGLKKAQAEVRRFNTLAAVADQSTPSGP